MQQLPARRGQLRIAAADPDKVPGAGVPVPVISGTVLLVVTVPTLLLTYRTYHP
jgi:hypothetical protein